MSDQKGEDFDLIVAGAGPAGAAAALSAARAGLSVALLERGREPGEKNVMGGLVYGHALVQALPEFDPRRAPVERTVVEQGYWLLTEEEALRLTFRRRPAPPGQSCYTVLRARFDPWFAARAEEAGAMLLPGTTVTSLLRDGDGRGTGPGPVVGVRTDRPDGDLRARAVIVATGVNSLPELLRQRPAGDLRADQVALAVKQVIELGEEEVNRRFGVQSGEGVAFELLGAATGGLLGAGFLYTNRDTVSVGLGVVLSDLGAAGVPPYELLERMKRHPAVEPRVAGGRVVEYSAHLIPEGGYDALPALAGDGWLVAGDAAGLVNGLRREGSNLALVSGLTAGQAVARARSRGDFSARTLGWYGQELARSFVLDDLRLDRRVMPYLLRRKELLRLYPDLLANLARAALTVDGEPRRVRARRGRRELWRARSPWRLLRDLAGLWRAFRG